MLKLRRLLLKLLLGKKFNISMYENKIDPYNLEIIIDIGKSHQEILRITTDKLTDSVYRFQGHLPF